MGGWIDGWMGGNLVLDWENLNRVYSLQEVDTANWWPYFTVKHALFIAVMGVLKARSEAVMAASSKHMNVPIEIIKSILGLLHILSKTIEETLCHWWSPQSNFSAGTTTFAWKKRWTLNFYTKTYFTKKMCAYPSDCIHPIRWCQPPLFTRGAIQR